MGASAIRRLCHWGPISVLGIIKLITWSMVHVLSMWWPPHASLGGALHACVFLALAVSTLYYFLQSLLEGPGFVPLGWKPDNEQDSQHLQYCTVCKGYKAPRSHHCKKCGQCVKKMDHHCPWINCCVGHNNHGYFTFFLMSAVLGCLHAALILPVCVYHAVNRWWYIRHGTGHEPLVHLTLTTLLLALLAIGMAAGVVLAVSALLFFQMRGILRNQTTIEEWIVEKAQYRRLDAGLTEFVFPYDVGRRANMSAALWPRHDGLQWPVRPGTHQYDLPREQRAQKVAKQARARLYVGVRQYSGRWVPLVDYLRPALRPPCSDEARLGLRRGDLVRVTRQNRQWLFGEKVLSQTDTESRGPRGWFPREAVEPAEAPKEKHD